MWNEIKIGQGDKRHSAWTIYCIPDGPSIAHNEVSYWISRCALGFNVSIMKDTPEGQELTRLLAAPESDPETIKRLLASLVFRNADPGVLLSRIDAANKEAFKAGQTAKTNELLGVLGLR